MAARTFKTRLALRIAVFAAAVFWAVILVLLSQYPGVTAKTFLSAAAFLVFFVLFTAHYEGFAITVTPDGVVLGSLWKRIGVRFEDIVKVEVQPGLAGTMYAILTRQGLIRFTSLIAGHRELIDQILSKANLARAGRF